MTARFAVVLDACVLYPAPVRDILLHLAALSFYRPLWSKKIHEEWMSSLLRTRKNLTRDRLERTRLLMDTCFEEALIDGYECLEKGLDLPDPNDTHVVAAAIKGGADAIVTTNLKDFPKEILAHHNLEAIHPDDFIRYQYDLNPSGFLQAIGNQRKSLKNPPYSQEKFVANLEECNLVLTGSLLRDYMEEI